MANTQSWITKHYNYKLCRKMIFWSQGDAQTENGTNMGDIPLIVKQTIYLAIGIY